MPQSVLSKSSAVKHQRLPRRYVSLPFVSMNASRFGDDSTLADRMNLAIEAERPHRPEWERRGKFTQNQVERGLREKYPAVFTSRGFISDYCHSDKARPSPSHIRLIADYLNVSVEWLLFGKGPMRTDVQQLTSTAELARHFAALINTRDDAWQAAWARNRDRAESLTVGQWLDEIESEAKRLDKAGVPRPEVAMAIRAAPRKYKSGEQPAVSATAVTSAND